MKKIVVRGKLFVWICALMVVALIGGCGSKAAESAPPVSPSPSASTQASVEPSAASPEASSDATATTRKIKTTMGEVEIPAEPKRVVVNWYIGDIFTLGIKPVAYNAWEQETMPFYDQFTGVAKIEKWEAEEILTHDPDLIITYDPQDFDKLSKIAPVIVVPESVKSTDRLTFLGEVTGHEKEAQAALETFNRKLEEAKAKLTSGVFQDKSFSIFEDWGRDSYGIFYETGSRGGDLLYDFLGLSKPEKLTKLVTDSGEGRGSLSYEVAAEYFGDYVIWFLNEKPSEYATTDIWNSIPAVKNGNIIEIPAINLGMFYYSDVMSMTAQLDYIVNKLVEQAGQ